ncbi:MAG: hypothetical protein J5497_01010, partial [Selenomonadaceae bacterium]|nr:hypothetical protein [Selenomonadaceae bacterium]
TTTIGENVTLEGEKNIASGTTVKYEEPTINVPATNSIVIDGNKVTLYREALGNDNVSVPDGYTLALGDNVPKEAKTLRDETLAYDSTNQTATYTGKKLSEFWTLNTSTNKSATRTAASGGEPFTITGLYLPDGWSLAIDNGTIVRKKEDETDVTLATIAISDTADGSGKKTGTVTLTKYAFDTSQTSQTVMLTDTDGVDVTYQLDATGLAKESDDGVKYNATFGDSNDDGTYEFKAKGNLDYYTLYTTGDGLTNGQSKITFTPATGGQTFTITGLTDGLTVDNDGTKIYKSSDTSQTALATISNDTVTLNNVLILGTVAAGGTKEITITKGSAATDTIDYKLAFGDAFKLLASGTTAPTSTANLLTTESESSNTYTYIGSHKPTYTVQDTTNTNKYTYHAEETGYATFTITGLKAGLASGNPLTVEADTYVKLGGTNNKVVTLTDTALSGANKAEISISGEGYTLADKQLNVTQAEGFYVDETTKTTINYNSQSTPAGYHRTTDTTYTYSEAVTGATKFTISGLPDLTGYTISVANDTGVITATKPEGGTPLTLGKLDSTTSTVYLKADAFGTTPSGTITLTDTAGDSTTYKLAPYTTDATYLNAFKLGGTTVSGNTVTVAADTAGVIQGTDGSGNTTLTYKGNSTETTVDITGLASGATAAASTAGKEPITLTSNNLSNYVVDGVLQSGYYKLGADITRDSGIKITSDVILDLNGKKFTVTGNGNEAIWIQKDGNLTVNDSGTDGAIISNEDWGIYVRPSNSDAKNWNGTNTLASLTINGGTVQGKLCGLGGNGGGHGTYIVINGGTVKNTHNEHITDTSKENCGIYHPQVGTLIINGGTISGYESAIEIRSGNLYVTGGTITATSSPTSSTPNSNGTTTKGAAIGVAQHTTHQNISVNITGGTIIGHTALAVTNPNSQTDGTLVLNISGGKFTSMNSANDKNAIYISDTRVTTTIGENVTLEGEKNIASGTTVKYEEPTINVPATNSIVITGTGNDKVVTLYREALDSNATSDVTVPTGYTLALGDNVPTKAETLRDESMALDADGKIATYTGKKYDEYWTVDESNKTSATHTAASNDGSFTIGGLNLQGYTITKTTTNDVTTFTATKDGESNITLGTLSGKTFTPDVGILPDATGETLTFTPATGSGYTIAAPTGDSIDDLYKTFYTIDATLPKQPQQFITTADGYQFTPEYTKAH